MFYNFNPVKLIHGQGAFEKAGVEVPLESVLTIVHGTTFDKHEDHVRKIISSWPKPPRIICLRVDGCEPTDVGIDWLVNQVDPATDFFLGVGGGSVLDATKAVAVCYGNKFKAHELRQYAPMSWSRTTKFGLIGTKPGSGSECNNAFVLMDGDTRYKRSHFSIYSYPLFAVHDPLFYESLSKTHYSSGLADAISHVIDQYLVEREPNVVQDLMSLSFLRMGKEMSNYFDNPQANKFLELAWFSSLISTGLLSRGVKTSWILHEVAHSLASVFSIPHAESIAMALEAVLSLPRHPTERLAQIATNLTDSPLKITDERDDIVDRITR